MTLEQLRVDKSKLLQQLSKLEEQLSEAGETKFDTFTSQMSNLSFIKPPRMEKGGSFTTYCDRFQAYVQMTDLKQNLDLLFMQNLDSETYRALKSTASSLTTAQKQNTEQMCKQFLTAMYGEESISLKNSLLNMKQKTGETITEFCSRVQEAGYLAYAEADLADEACLLTILRGLSCKNIRRKLNEATPSTFADAIKQAKRLDSVARMFENEPTPILKTSSENRAIARFSSSTSRGWSPPPNSRGKYRDSKQNVRCWRCGEKGHYKSECLNLN